MGRKKLNLSEEEKLERRKEQIKKARAKYKIEKRRCVENLTAEQLERKREGDRKANLTEKQIEDKRKRSAESYKRSQAKRQEVRAAIEASGGWERAMDKHCRVCMEKQEEEDDTTGSLVSRGDSQPETICPPCLQDAEIAYDKRHHLPYLEVFTITEFKSEKSDEDGESQQVDFESRREESKDDFLDKDEQTTAQFHGHVKSEVFEEDFRAQIEAFRDSFQAQVKNEPIGDDFFEEEVNSFDGKVKTEHTEDYGQGES